MGDGEKQMYTAEAAKDKARYEKEVEAYRKSNPNASMFQVSKRRDASASVLAMVVFCSSSSSSSRSSFAISHLFLLTRGTNPPLFFFAEEGQEQGQGQARCKGRR